MPFSKILHPVRSYLCLHVCEFACLLRRLGQEVGSHLQHGCSVVVDGALLQLGHLGLHLLSHVALNLNPGKSSC